MDRLETNNRHRRHHSRTYLYSSMDRLETLKCR